MKLLAGIDLCSWQQWQGAYWGGKGRTHENVGRRWTARCCATYICKQTGMLTEMSVVPMALLGKGSRQTSQYWNISTITRFNPSPNHLLKWVSDVMGYSWLSAFNPSDISGYAGVSAYVVQLWLPMDSS